MGEAQMSVRYKIGLVMLACVAVGALGGETLHGQARPPAYLIGQIDVSNPDGFAREYLPKAREIIKAHGGRLIAAGTGSQIIAVDGEAPTKRVVIYMYPNLEALQAWRNDPEYVQVRHAGEKYATYHTFAIEGPAGGSP
jgi:uncharacterized protein (DUF1330 family)